MTTDTDTRAPAPPALGSLAAAREEFMALVAELRPELHRYCARMTGSVFEGEDVLQDVLAKAYFALSRMTELPALRPWLFRIAHNTAMDFRRRYDHQHVEVVAEPPEPQPHVDDEDAVDPALLEAALSVFLELPPVQRSALVLKEILGHSLEEVATALGMTVGAVKGSLSRARANLAKKPPSPVPASRRSASAEELANLRRYAELFNARDWDGLRTLVSDQAELDLASRRQQSLTEARYFERYAEVVKVEDVRAEVGFVDGLPALAVYRTGERASPAYFKVIEWYGGRVSSIRDYRYVPYIAQGARFIRLT